MPSMPNITYIIAIPITKTTGPEMAWKNEPNIDRVIVHYRKSAWPMAMRFSEETRNLVCKGVGTVCEFLEEISILKIDQNCIVLNVTFLTYFIDDFFSRKWTFVCENFT